MPASIPIQAAGAVAIGSVETPNAMNELGQQLREARESRGISLAEAEAQTRIRQKFIAAMEAEEWTLLPNDVTTRGFLRKYAIFLGLDEESIVQRFQSRGNVAAAQPLTSAPLDRDVDYRPIEMDLSSPTRRSIPWGWIGAALVVLVLIGAALYLNYFQPTLISNLLALPRSLPSPADVATPAPTDGAAPTATVEINRITATPTATPEATAMPSPTPPATAVAATVTLTATATPPPAQSVERMTLDLAVLARSWVRLLADNSVVLEAVLEPGELRSFEAAESILLRTGNADGIQVTLNGQTLPPLGGTSEVVQVQWLLVDGQIVQSTPASPAPTEAAPPESATEETPEPAPEETPTP